jgi:CBS domain-containing protein
LIAARRRRNVRADCGQKQPNREAQMSVAHILAAKGGEVVTTQPHRTLTEVIELLASRGIGAVVVADAARKVLGIISERDIVRAVAAGGAAALGEPASRHMTAKVFTVTESTPIDRVMETMTAGRFRHVPVLDDDKLIGLVSIGDVVKYRVNEIETEHRALRDYIATA